MTIQFTQVALADVREDIKRHLTSLPSAIDGFLEGHIRESIHYRIRVGEEIAGLAAIHKGNLITHFSLATDFRRYGQSVYREVKKLEQVQSAFVPTCDELFLSHALEDYRQLNKQAYFFAAGPFPVEESTDGRFSLRLAEKSDMEAIREGSGDFFDKIEERIDRQELYLTLAEAQCVGFGIREKSELAGDVASIGMFILERFRRQGAGAATLRLLRKECEANNLRPVAGCWYYNHNSKKTLERAGMYTQTRLLKVDY